MDYFSEDVRNESQIFLPAHPPGDLFLAFVVRVKGRPEERVAPIREAIRSVDAHVPVFGAMTMEQRLNNALSRPKFYRTSLLFFAGFALLLSVIGIYAVISYAVAKRTREMGVRLALGTTPARLRGWLLGQGLVPVAAGAILGVGGAIGTGRFLDSLIEGAKALDSATYVFSIVLLLLIASTSIWAGSRRIAALDIVEVLRAE